MIKKELSNRFKSQICLRPAFFLISLNFINPFILIALYEILRDFDVDCRWNFRSLPAAQHISLGVEPTRSFKQCGKQKFI